MSVTHNITIFILQVTRIHSGFKPSSGLIQEQRHTKNFETAIEDGDLLFTLKYIINVYKYIEDLSYKEPIYMFVKAVQI